MKSKLNRMDGYLIKILGSGHSNTDEQISEAYTRWPSSLRACMNRASHFKAMKERLDEDTEEKTRNILSKIHDTSVALEPLTRESSDVEKEGFSQVLFEGTPWSELNYIPFALVLVSLFKSYVVPAASLMLPLLSWILPYIFLRVVYNVPIEFTDYTQLIWRMWNGRSLPKTPEELALPDPPVDSVTQIKQLLQNGWTLFTLGQALWQPIQQARHFMTLDRDCQVLGNSILSLSSYSKDLLFTWKEWLPPWFSYWASLCPSEERQAFAFVRDYPYWLPHMFRGLGRFEATFILACRKDTVPAVFVKSEKPLIAIHGFGDPSIPMNKRVLSSVSLGGKSHRHAIITGPNRGGKSSCMRGVLLNVMTAHTFGASFSEKFQLSYFSWIADGMRLDDLPGTMSMFEREVSFASSILHKEGGSGLVLYDELFHSTNPPDAICTSELFCKNLWKKENCVSMVSTHVYSLARSAPSTVKALCVGAKKEGDRIDFSYKLQQGICEVSSVNLLLGQYGFH
jgi:hypothetical protein